jgi:hypothetical protein
LSSAARITGPSFRHIQQESGRPVTPSSEIVSERV